MIENHEFTVFKHDQYSETIGSHDVALIHTERSLNSMPICLSHGDSQSNNFKLTTFDESDTFSAKNFSIIEKRVCFEIYKSLNYLSCDEAATINQYQFCTAEVRNGLHIGTVEGEQFMKCEILKSVNEVNL